MIDIVIPTYNGAKHLPGLLASISRQSYTKYRCFVIDDNSQDNCVDIIKQKFPWVELIERSSNCGPAENRNYAIRLGAGEYIVVFDDDVYLEDSKWLEKAVEVMEANPEVGQLASMILNGFNPEVLLDCGLERHGCLFGGRFHNVEIVNASSKHLLSSNVLGACSAGTIFRRKLFEEIGGFDQDYFYPAEDLDLSLRIILAGYDVRYEPSLVTYHYESQAMGKVIERKMYMYKRNCLLALFENYPLLFSFALVGRHVIIKNAAHLLRLSKDPKHISGKELLYISLYLVRNFWKIAAKRIMFDRVRKHSRKYLINLTS